MKYLIQGGSKFSLTSRDFLAEGGEGKVYVSGGLAYKIYADPSKMVPEGKIVELSAITDPRVIKPEKLVYDEKGKAVGFTSRFAPSGGVVCQLFTKAFRDRNGLSPADVGELVIRLRYLVANVHSAKVLLVDLNEMNFLLGPDLKDVFGIDVASYQTPHYPATALMESVRDRHAPPNKFSELTDWFAFAVVSFRMLVGIHPFKGTHPAVKDFDERMKSNLSVLNRDVRVPPACYPFSDIPGPYLDWYRSVFEKGDRTAPPTGFAGTIVPVLVAVAPSTSASLDIREFGSYDGDVLGAWEKFGHLVVSTKTSLYSDGHRVGDARKGVCGVGFTSGGAPVVASLDGRTLSLFDANLRSPVSFGLDGDGMMTYDGRVYLKNGAQVVRVSFREMGANSQVVASSEVAANVLEHATKMFEGVVVQNLLGSVYVSVFPESGSTVQFRVPELDRVKIVDAKFDGGVLMVLGSSNGVYDRYIFRVNEDSEYDLRVVRDVTPSGLNFVTLPSGTCVSLTEESKLELFSSRKGSTTSRVVEDRALHGGMRLYRNGGKVIFSSGSKLYSLSLK